MAGRTPLHAETHWFGMTAVVGSFQLRRIDRLTAIAGNETPDRRLTHIGGDETWRAGGKGGDETRVAFDLVSQPVDWLGENAAQRRQRSIRGISEVGWHRPRDWIARFDDEKGFRDSIGNVIKGQPITL